MDLNLDESQEAVRDLAHQILEDRSTPDRLREVEADDGFDRSTWKELSKAGLLGLDVPEELGGGGLSVLAVSLVAEAVGRRTAAVPFRHAATVASALARAGSHRDVVEAHLAGELVLTAALTEGHDHTARRRPTTTATREGSGWVLRGDKVVVPFGTVADMVLVPARVGEDAGALFLVDSAAAGVQRTAVTTTAALPAANLHLDGVAVDGSALVGSLEEGTAALGTLLDHVDAVTCRAMAGVCDGALALAAAYTSEREQFGSKIGTFQAVAHRLADAYIDAQAISLTALQACWRLSEERPAARELATAIFWATEGGQRVVHATQHVHGGIGVDTDYPLHRYFRWAKALEIELGGATQSLRTLGAELASEPVGG